MADSLKEKVRYILDDSDFNDLPYEERARISRYTAEMQILTLYQVLIKDNDNTTKAWRRKIKAWLKNCVDNYYNVYRYPSDDHTEPKPCEECKHWKSSFEECTEIECNFEPMQTEPSTDCSWK